MTEHFNEKQENDWDCVICIGPSDDSMVSSLIPNIKERMAPRRIYIITLPSIIKNNKISEDYVHWVSENQFPFSINDIHDMFKTPERSGWYLQQLLKLYAPIVLPELLDQYIIVDADVRVHKDLRFFKNGKIQFNVGTEYHLPYFDHMFRLNGMTKRGNYSGICHLMPMKRHIVQAFIKDIENRNGKELWKAFLEKVDPAHYGSSGASEYELLFTYAQTYFSHEINIVPLKWQNTNTSDVNSLFDYEAYHWYMR
jgi:hypothetical protein